MDEQVAALHPIAISQVMVNFAAAHGVAAETCLRGTGITSGQLKDAEALIRREQEMRLIENLLRALPDIPALGFELGQRYKVATFGPWGFVLRTSRNLREATDRALRYLALSTAYCRFSVFSDGAEFGLTADASEIPVHLRQFLLERDMATGIGLVDELGLSGISVQRVEFQCEDPGYGSRIEELCGVRPTFGCARNAVTIRAADADMPLAMYDPQLVSLLEEQCRTQLRGRQLAGAAGKTRRLLLVPLGLDASLEEVARAMAMSPRTLRRKLEEEGDSFRSIVDAERKQLAGQLLKGTDLKMESIALHLGYGDAASFTRAFRRWFGMSPGEYRSAAEQ